MIPLSTISMPSTAIRSTPFFVVRSRGDLEVVFQVETFATPGPGEKLVALVDAVAPFEKSVRRTQPAGVVST